MKLFVRVITLALALVFIVASQAEAQRGPGGPGGGMGRGPGGPGGGIGRGPGGPGGGIGRPSRPGGPIGGPIGGPRRGGPVHRPVPYPYPSGYCGLYGCDSYYGSVDCAPEVVEGNTKATDRVLASLVKSSDFAQAKTFKAEVARISALKDNLDKSNNYLALVGIDPENSEAVVEFIGAREAKGAWLNDLQKNADLTSAQAEVVAQALQSALRGGLQ